MTMVKKPTWIGTGLNEVGGVVRGLAERNLPCLVVGPTGTGKELMTQLYAFCWQAKWKKYRYHRLNCTGFVEGLLTSHLFGYEGGSFTGAAPRGKKGLVDANDLICLDELGDASASFQAQVLRVVEYGTFTKVGGTKEEHTKCCFIGSTNNLDGVRTDLRHRFHVVHIPPLVLRPDDFVALAIHFGRNAGVGEFTQRFAVWAAQYAWPGNARELRRRIEFAALASGAVLDVPSSDEILRDPSVYWSFNSPHVRAASVDRRPLSELRDAYDACYSKAAAALALSYEEARQTEQEEASPIAAEIGQLTQTIRMRSALDGVPRLRGRRASLFGYAPAARIDVTERESPPRHGEIETAVRTHRSRAAAAEALGLNPKRLAREAKHLGIDISEVIKGAGGLTRRKIRSGQ